MSKTKKIIVVLLIIFGVTQAVLLMRGVLLPTSNALTYEKFVNKATVDTNEATIGTNIFLHQKIYGVDHINYRYKLETDCPHWKYEDRYMSDTELPYIEDEAAVETEAKEITISLDDETLLVAQHFYVPVLDLYDEDISFEEWEDKQMHIAYDTYIENSKSNFRLMGLAVPLFLDIFVMILDI